MPVDHPSANSSPGRADTIRAVILVLVGSLGAQFSAVIAMGLFEPLGVLPTSSLRMLISAIILLALFRPKLPRTGAEWLPILVFGVAMATSNLFLYLALDRIPFGVATTIEFLGPCLVALTVSRSIRDGLLAVAAFVGVALIAGIGGPFDPIGLMFAGFAGISFALYTIFAARVGKSTGGLTNVALALAVAAILTMPFSAPAIPHVEPAAWGLLALSALLGTALPFTVDTLAGKLTSARVIGVLFAFDPVISTILGAIILAQIISVSALAGMALVIAAGAGLVWFAGSGRNP